MRSFVLANNYIMIRFASDISVIGEKLLCHVFSGKVRATIDDSIYVLV